MCVCVISKKRGTGFYRNAWFKFCRAAFCFLLPALCARLTSIRRDREKPFVPELTAAEGVSDLGSATISVFFSFPPPT